MEVASGGNQAGTSFGTLTLALLPGMMQHYEDPLHQHMVCREAAGRIAVLCSQLGSNGKLDNLATVMDLYERAAFSKDAGQWTKCVVKYLLDGFSALGPHLLQLAVGLLDRGPALLHGHLLDILFYLLHYVDLSSEACESAGRRLVLALTTRHLEQREHWKAAQRILKLCVSKSAVLTAPPQHKVSEMPLVPLPEAEAPRVELPGRVLDFRFDVQQVPLIAKELLDDSVSLSSVGGGGSVSSNSANPSTNSPASVSNRHSSNTSLSTEQKSPEKGEGAVSPVAQQAAAFMDNTPAWRRPWLCQNRVRERLVHLCTAFGQRLGMLPKSPSVSVCEVVEECVCMCPVLYLSRW